MREQQEPENPEHGLSEEESGRIKKYLIFKEQHNEPVVKNQKVCTVDVQQTGKLLTDCHKAICVGDAYTVLQSNVQSQLRDLQKAADIKYARIGDVAFDELLGEVGLPIGNLTSQMFANLYLNELDQFCKHKLHLHYYIRYMDDIIILHSDKKYLEKIKNKIADFLGSKLHLQLNKKTCIRPTSMGIEFVGFRIWSTHVKLRKKTAKKLKRRLKYMFAAYHAGEIDKDTLDRSVASYRGILQHFNSYGMRQSLNELYLQEMGKPYPEPEKKPASKCGLFCGYYGSTDDYIKQPEEKEVTDSGSNTDA